MANIDTTTIDSSETLNQLRIDSRQFLPEVLKSIKKITKAKLEDKSGHLEKGFRNLLYAESVYQKIKVKFLYVALNTAEQLSAQIKADPQENKNKLSTLNDLRKMFPSLDTENAYEERKATNMRGVSKQIWRKIEGIIKDTQNFVAANDNTKNQKAA